METPCQALVNPRVKTEIICVQHAIRSEVSFRFDMHNCFKAVVKQKCKKIRSHTLGARGVGPLGGTVREDCFV